MVKLILPVSEYLRSADNMRPDFPQSDSDHPENQSDKTAACTFPPAGFTDEVRLPITR